MDYKFYRIYPNDSKTMEKLDILLKKEGIVRDKNLDYTVGLMDDDLNLVGTGSCYKNTFRCLAVDSSHQGEGLLNQIMTHLISYQYQRGNTELFLYTKCNNIKFFNDLGFYEIARVEDKIVFMENHRTGFPNYLNQLTQSKRVGTSVAAVIVNANPFTLGHQFLLEKAAGENDILHVFVVSEDISLVPFNVRYKLVKEGTTYLNNLVYHQTGSYMISNATFPSYFLKDEDIVIESQAKLDIEVFKQIALSLGIVKRYVGEEPFSQVTSIYNRIMKEQLDEIGIECIVVPRKTSGSVAISASKVRQMIHDGNVEGIRDVVPENTYRFFLSAEADDIVRKISLESDVVHY